MGLGFAACKVSTVKVPQRADVHSPLICRPTAHLRPRTRHHPSRWGSCSIMLFPSPGACFASSTTSPWPFGWWTITRAPCRCDTTGSTDNGSSCYVAQTARVMCDEVCWPVGVIADVPVVNIAVRPVRYARVFGLYSSRFDVANYGRGHNITAAFARTFCSPHQSSARRVHIVVASIIATHIPPLCHGRVGCMLRKV